MQNRVSHVLCFELNTSAHPPLEPIPLQAIQANLTRESSSTNKMFSTSSFPRQAATQTGTQQHFVVYNLAAVCAS